MGAEKLLLFMWNKIRDPSTHFVRSGCQGVDFFALRMLERWCFLRSGCQGVELFVHDAGECFFSLRVSWRKTFRSKLAKDGTAFAVCMALEYIRSLRMSICGVMACEVCSTNFFVICYTKTWHVEWNVSINTWSRNISALFLLF